MHLIILVPYIFLIEICHSNTGEYAYNFYYTDSTTTDGSNHCLYFIDDQISEIGDIKASIEQTIEYCFRPLSKKNEIINEIGISSILTFDEMKTKGITIENLIEWSSSIDLIERYEHYLQTNQSSSDDLFYLCIEPWFGPFCQYSFDFNNTFMNIVRIQSHWKQVKNLYGKSTCYVHLKCQHFLPLSCLDWREICDGKWDCLDGQDEENCLELELNQCDENEYQCRNGMCIYKEFLLDDTLDFRSPECLDGSDEASIIFKSECHQLVVFRCEDVIPRYPQQMSCRDGNNFLSVLPREIFECRNRHDLDFSYIVNWRQPNDTRFPFCFKMYICAIKDLTPNQFNSLCKTFCLNQKECVNKTLKSCPSAMIAPTFPVWDGHVRLGYFMNLTGRLRTFLKPDFVCYDAVRCPFFVSDFILENYTCIYIQRLNLTDFNEFITKFLPCHRHYQSTNQTHCLYPNMLRCGGTNKCIPYRRVMDGIWDCYGGFDESNVSNPCAIKDNYRFECKSEKKCLSPMLVDNSENDCFKGEDEHFLTDQIMSIDKLLFSAICDSWTDMIVADNETDETNCEEWPCSNQYTRCNHAWNCRHGEDELNCTPEFSCPSNHHPCLLPNKLHMDCIHMNLTENGIVNCLGATDERLFCKSNREPGSFPYRCWNETLCQAAYGICGGLCHYDNIRLLCEQSYEENKTAVEIIDYLEYSNDRTVIIKQPFSLHSSRSFPPEQTSLEIDDDDDDEKDVTDITEYLIDGETIDASQLWSCYRGILIRIGETKTVGCLCPQNYYSNYCRYQNQRVSLTLRLRKESFRTLDIIGLVIRLVDQTGFIHSHEQITFIPSLDCNTKFNIYLLYQKRPKDMKNNYTIEIDAFDKTNLTYLTSWTLKIRFLFLPINRVSAQLNIPIETNSTRSFDYRNNFISHCSSDAIAIGSICLCPLNKTGPRCYIKSICHNQICQNGGICVPYGTRVSLKSFVCVCSEGFFGERCEKRQVSISISFSDIETTDSLLLHYITVDHDYLGKIIKLPRATLFKKIPYHLTTIQVYMPFPFHLLYAQIHDSYYLILLQHNYTSSVNFSVQISSSNHCPRIDQQGLDSLILRRVKSYHSLCQKNPNLLCFHDKEVFMCLCTEERHANCFHFDFDMTYDCQGENQCKNKGRCYQDHRTCPKMRICVCPTCFYGSKCQLYAKHLGVTLDSIIGYHIYPNIPFTEQSKSVHISVSISIIMLVIVLITGSLSIWTFQLKTCRETGCGLYLYFSSIFSIITIFLLNLKVLFLILSQMISNLSRPFVLFNCITMDFLLRLCLALIDWLHAAVAIERFLVVYLEVKFNKNKSKQAAKRAIFIIILLIILSHIHDPIHRDLLDDNDENRIWCLTRYSSSIEIYNSFINIVHFIVPFSINLLSAISIIALTARQRSKGQEKTNLWNQLKKQFDLHKHLLISSILVIILALPRVIISFLPNCMTSPRDYQLYLAGYFISFVPPLLTFFIFVLTSKKYKTECYAETMRKWAVVKRRFNS